MSYSNEFIKEVAKQMEEFGVSPERQQKVNESIQYLNTATIKPVHERNEEENRKFDDAFNAVGDIVEFLNKKSGEALDAEIAQMYIATNYTFVQADAMMTGFKDFRVYYQGQPVYDRGTNTQRIVNALNETQAAKIYQNFLNELKNEK